MTDGKTGAQGKTKSLPTLKAGGIMNEPSCTYYIHVLPAILSFYRYNRTIK